MVYFLIWLGFGLIAAMIGARKGEAIGGFVIGMLLGPIGILIAIFSSGNRRPCSYCKELISKEAKICPHCRKDLTPQAQPGDDARSYII